MWHAAFPRCPAHWRHPAAHLPPTFPPTVLIQRTGWQFMNEKPKGKSFQVQGEKPLGKSTPEKLRK